MEISDNFNILLKKKMHNELILKLDSILKNIIENDKELDLNGIENAIQNMTIKKEIAEIPNAIIALSDTILKRIQDLQVKRPTEWVFDIERDNEGYIDKVIANGK